jgi:hypothetical protein
MPVAGFEETDLPAAPLHVSQALNPIDTASPSTASPSLAQIEDALDQLLTRLLKEREQERKKRAASGQPPSFRVISAAELVAEPIKSEQEVWREILIDRAITGSLEYAIHELGEVLFQRGGTKLMREALERVARRNPKTSRYRASIMDKKWDGIGNRWFC